MAKPEQVLNIEPQNELRFKGELLRSSIDLFHGPPILALTGLGGAQPPPELGHEAGRLRGRPCSAGCQRSAKSGVEGMTLRGRRIQANFTEALHNIGGNIVYQ